MLGDLLLAKEFKDFIARHSVLAMPAGFMTGAAFVVSIWLFVAAGQALAQSGLGTIEEQSRSIRPIEDRPLAPEIAFKDRNGRDWGFVEFRGRPLVVTFWATWCPVCAVEMPQLDRLQAELGGMGIKVIALSIDREGVAAVERYFARRGIRHLEAYSDVEAILASVMGIEGVPTSFIIDADGRIAGAAEGGVDWSAAQVRAFIEGLSK